jgi:hypothetical protein
MEFEVIEKRPQSESGKGTMYQKVIDAANDMEMDQELAIAKNGKKSLRHTVYQLIVRKELALKVSEDKDTVYLTKLSEPYVQNKRS